MLGNYRVSKQLEISRVVLSSIELVIHGINKRRLNETVCTSPLITHDSTRFGYRMLWSLERLSLRNVTF
jgi:hypothetical protein